ncbi:MAG: uncharacterized protein A8A55_2140 [Amphiamblys sp. WSBS2006]|nr:MAG: uncharacterized protein A8A55_2140 [Amphiamblys sp. WSBS2006]
MRFINGNQSGRTQKRSACGRKRGADVLKKEAEKRMDYVKVVLYNSIKKKETVQQPRQGWCGADRKRRLDGVWGQEETHSGKGGCSDRKKGCPQKEEIDMAGILGIRNRAESQDSYFDFFM